MKTILITALLALSLIPTVSHAQGSLTPPSGPPVATMKSIDELWDKIPIKVNRIPISSLPFTIGTSGEYYLTKNLEFSDTTGHAITIAVRSVTLDLNGFRITSSDDVTGDAINFIGIAEGVKIMNGRISGGTTITAGTGNLNPRGFSSGINAVGSIGCKFADLHISGCRANGLVIGNNNAVEKIICYSNGSNGIFANGSDNDLSHCQCTGNKNYGIYAPDSILNACVTSYNGAGLSAIGGVVSNCLARYNKYDGITVTNGVVSFCAASNNNQAGLTYLDINATGATRTGNRPTP